MILKNKKLISLLILITFLVVGVLGFIDNVSAVETSDEVSFNREALSQTLNGAPPDATSIDQNKSDSTENSIVNVLAWIVFYIATFFSWLVNIIVRVMVYVASYNHFLDTQVVKNGWSIVRDVANNFFIVILLVIAVGTILRVPNYNRQLLPKLLVMAVLINFSKVFTGVLIDFSQVITLWLAGAIKGTSEGGNIILLALGLQNLYRIDTTGLDFTDPLPGGGLNGAEVLKTLLFALILSVVAVVVMAMITIVLVYRIVMLWFLVILSPLAFLLTTFPKGQQYAGMWWSELAKYLVVGPVMLFFLYLSFFSGSINIDNASSASGNASVTTETGSLQLQDNVRLDEQLLGDKLGLTNLQNSPVKFFDFLIIIGLMVGSLVAGQKTGVKGGEWAGKGVSNLQKWGKKATLGTAGLVGAGALRGATAIPGARRIPIVGTMAGKAVDQRKVQLATTKAKAEQEKITARSGALDLGGKSESELRKLALEGDKYAKIAATQAMMKQGMFRDDDKVNRDENIKMINNAKKMLPPELASTFEENTKKYNPGLAHDTVYKNDKGEFRTDAFVSDVKTGKVKAHEMIPALSSEQIADLNKSLLKDKNINIADFLLENVSEKDLGEMNGNLSKESREKIWNKDNISHESFKKKENPDTGKVEITDAGKKKRDKFNKVTNFNNIMQTFDENSQEDVESIRTFVSNNGNDIGKKMKEVSEEFVDSFGDLIKPSQFKDQAPAIQEKLKKSFEAVINKIEETDISPQNNEQQRAKIKNALMSGAKFKESSIDETTDPSDPTGKKLLNNNKRQILKDIMSTSTVKDVESMKNLTQSTIQTRMAAENLDTNVIKGLSASTDGSLLVKPIVDELEGLKAGLPANSELAKKYDKLKDIT